MRTRRSSLANALGQIIRFDDTDNVQLWDIGANLAFRLKDVTSDTTPFIVRVGAPTAAILVDSSGDVGLGIDSPTAALHVLRSGGAGNMLQLTNGGLVQLNLEDTTGANWEFQVESGGGNRFLVNETTTNGVEALFASSGNLFLRGRLTVCATATGGTPGCAPSNTTLPDYVFEPGYELMPLSELEEFVRTEKHLPNVMSAADAKDGIDIFAFQLQLLEKVEELTLHTITQQKTIERQNEQAKQQAKEKDERIAKLEQRLSRLETFLTAGSAD